MSSHLLGMSLGIFMVAFMLFIGILAIAGLLLTIYVFYDVIFRQEKMQTAEKLIWLGIVLFLNLPGVLIYLLLVRYQGEYVMGEKQDDA
ncbi:MAG: PLD nuclease N-terminal domain-containing protein [Candidatus Nanohaloarchaea archaeon]|nr:PLD nuclease N-terminal domain-containing protein [Candidatus Nanohaloarchaea archaeon]